MKFKVIHDRKTHERCLITRLAKDEELDYIKAERLLTLHEKPFLPFSYAAQKDESAVLTYDVSDVIALGTYLGARLSHSQFRALMTDVVYAVEACAHNEFSYTEFVFDPRYVYVDAQTNQLKLVYLPATHPSGKRATIIDVLHYIATHTKFVCKEDLSCSTSLLDYLKRHTIFSLVDFKAFIDFGDLKTRTGNSVSLLETNDNYDQIDARKKSAELKGPALEAASSKNFSTDNGAYDFVKVQAGALSNEETRASQNLAERISFEVADVASVPTESTKATVRENAPSSCSLSALARPHKQPNPAVSSDLEPLEFTPHVFASDTSVPPPTGPVRQSLCIVRVSTGERYPLSYLREMTIGRSKRCDICVGGNTNISRIHAILEVKDNGCLVTDQGTTNKTSIGSKELLAHVALLALPEDEIVLADELFRLEAR